MRKFQFIVIVLLAVSNLGRTQVKKVFEAVSPDKSTTCHIGYAKNGQPVYKLMFRGVSILDWSPLGIQLEGNGSPGKTALRKVHTDSKNETFPWIFGERDSINNSYNGYLYECKQASFKYLLEIRMFNGSLAFRYRSADSKDLVLKGEATGFCFDGNYTLYQYNQESIFTPVGIDTLTKTCDFPATLTNGKFYLSIGEAANSFYTKAELKKGDSPNSLQVSFMKDAEVSVSGEALTPWRTVSIAGSAIELLSFSDLYFKLNPPSALPPAASIKPGKLIRAGLTTQAGLDCIDFAVKHNFQYIMYDAGWYGAEFRSSSDPTQVIPQINMPEVINYATKKGIGVILYVNYVGLKAKLDTLLPLFKKWGVAGFKFGFVDGLSQQGIQWLNEAIRKVNQWGFVLNIHDNYKPTGLSRTYPALLTQEGIRGDENSPDAFHNTVLPFTRFLAGPADFTFCFPNPKNRFAKNLKVSKAQQLALTVVYYSPLQAIFWYGNPNDYTNSDELEFFDHVPTVWNETHHVKGELGRNISIARRNGDNWYLGAVAGLEDWLTDIKLDFLSPDLTYEATIYSDGSQESIERATRMVKKGDRLSLSLKAKGGQAVILRPVK